MGRRSKPVTRVQREDMIIAVRNAVGLEMALTHRDRLLHDRAHVPNRQLAIGAGRAGTSWRTDCNRKGGDPQ